MNGPLETVLDPALRSLAASARGLLLAIPLISLLTWLLAAGIMRRRVRR
jgi:cell division inhibitor SulA